MALPLGCINFAKLELGGVLLGVLNCLPLTGTADFVDVGVPAS